MGIGSRQSSAHKLKFPRDAHCQVTHPLWFHESYGWALEQYYKQTRDITIPQKKKTRDITMDQKNLATLQNPNLVVSPLFILLFYL